MMAINFLYKVSKLTKKNGDVTTMIKVFNPLDNIVTTINKLEDLNDIEIKYYLQTDTKFNYKHYQIYFTESTSVKF